MRFRQGAQAEVLLSLALVMVTGTGLLAALFLEIDQARVERLHGLLSRGFVASVGDSSLGRGPDEQGLWWTVDPLGRATGLNASTAQIDPETLALGLEAFAYTKPIVLSGAPWSPIRFAALNHHGPGAVVGRIDAPVSGFILAVLLVTDVLIFGLFGVSLLQRRVSGPLHRLATRVREIGQGDLPASVAIEGVGEIEALGSAFNEMQAALASRTGALEKAVVDLRSANSSLIQARAGLDRAERLAMVGSLAAGVAHEVGNPMGAMLAFLDVASRDEGLGEDGRKCLAKASEQGERVRIILRQLLDFSRPPQVQHVAISLDAIARQVVELISAQRDYADIEFAVDSPTDLPLAMGDASLVSQILLNLAMNAASELTETNERRIRFELSVSARRGRTGEDMTVAAGLRPDAVVCRVLDSGAGVDPDVRERVFDPFFTTKSPGAGTGLGLANSRRFAEEMDGDVELEDAVCELGGAAFRLVLPIQGRSPGCIAKTAPREAEVREPNAIG